MKYLINMFVVSLLLVGQASAQVRIEHYGGCIEFRPGDSNFYPCPTPLPTGASVLETNLSYVGGLGGVSSSMPVTFLPPNSADRASSALTDILNGRAPLFGEKSFSLGQAESLRVTFKYYEDNKVKYESRLYATEEYRNSEGAAIRRLLEYQKSDIGKLNLSRPPAGVSAGEVSLVKRSLMTPRPDTVADALAEAVDRLWLSGEEWAVSEMRAHGLVLPANGNPMPRGADLAFYPTSFESELKSIAGRDLRVAAIHLHATVESYRDVCKTPESEGGLCGVLAETVKEQFSAIQIADHLAPFTRGIEYDALIDFSASTRKHATEAKVFAASFAEKFITHSREAIEGSITALAHPLETAKALASLVTKFDVVMDSLRDRVEALMADLESDDPARVGKAMGAITSEILFVYFNPVTLLKLSKGAQLLVRECQTFKNAAQLVAGSVAAEKVLDKAQIASNAAEKMGTLSRETRDYLALRLANYPGTTFKNLMENARYTHHFEKFLKEHVPGGPALIKETRGISREIEVAGVKRLSTAEDAFTDKPFWKNINSDQRFAAKGQASRHAIVGHGEEAQKFAAAEARATDLVFFQQETHYKKLLDLRDKVLVEKLEEWMKGKVPNQATIYKGLISNDDYLQSQSLSTAARNLGYDGLILPKEGHVISAQFLR